MKIIILTKTKNWQNYHNPKGKTKTRREKKEQNTKEPKAIENLIKYPEIKTDNLMKYWKPSGSTQKYLKPKKIILINLKKERLKPVWY